jgi:hypothetical protein
LGKELNIEELEILQDLQLDDMPQDKEPLVIEEEEHEYPDYDYNRTRVICICRKEYPDFISGCARYDELRRKHGWRQVGKAFWTVRFWCFRIEE